MITPSNVLSTQKVKKVIFSHLRCDFVQFKAFLRPSFKP